MKQNTLCTVRTEAIRKALSKLLLLGTRNPEPYSTMASMDIGMEGVGISRSTPNSFLSLLVDAEVDSMETVAVSVETLHAIASKTPEESIVFSRLDGKLIVESSGGSAKLSVFPEDIQQFNPSGEVLAEINGDCDAILTAIKCCLPAATRILSDSSKSAMHGVGFRTMDGKVNIIGCDGRSITVCETEHEADIDIIIPTAEITVLARLIEVMGKSELNIEFREGGFIAQCGDMKYAGCLLSGKFPNLTALIARPDGKHHSFNRAEMLSALNAVSATQNEMKKIVLVLKQDECSITADSYKESEMTRRICCKSSEPDSFGIHSEVFRECLLCMTSETVEVFLDGILRMWFQEDGKTFAIGLMRVAGVA